MLAENTILIVDDDPAVASALADCLRQEGYACTQITNGHEALQSVRQTPPDLILLDRMLPGLPGDDVIVKLKGDPRSRAIPVIMITGKNDESDEFVGLSLGADDYVTKPFSIKVLLARIAAKLRHKAAVDEIEESLPLTSIMLDRSQPRVFVDKTPIALSTTEYKILAALIAARGHVLGRQQLSSMVYGKKAAPDDQRIPLQVQELRRKMGPAAGCIQALAAEHFAFCYPAGQRAPA
jgi:two-component system phosphate regulon response regulator PhoB